MAQISAHIKTTSFYTRQISFLPAAGWSLYWTRSLFAPSSELYSASGSFYLFSLTVCLYISVTHGPSGKKWLSNPQLCFLVMQFPLHTQHLLSPVGLLQTVMLLLLHGDTSIYFWLYITRTCDCIFLTTKGLFDNNTSPCGYLCVKW